MSRFICSILASVLLLSVSYFVRAHDGKPVENLLIPTATPPLQDDESAIATLAAAYLPRDACVEAVESGTMGACQYFISIDSFDRSELEQLFPDTRFFLLSLGSWKSSTILLAHEGQEGAVGLYLIAWQDGRTYTAERFEALLEKNGITTITGDTAEQIGRAFALMSIQNYLAGDVQFLAWTQLDQGWACPLQIYSYTHQLSAWTEVWGCSITWYFSIEDQQLRYVTMRGGECYEGDYIEDNTHFARDCEASLLNVPPYERDYSFYR